MQRARKLVPRGDCRKVQSEREGEKLSQKKDKDNPEAHTFSFSEPPKRARKIGGAREMSKSVENVFDDFMIFGEHPVLRSKWQEY